MLLHKSLSFQVVSYTWLLVFPSHLLLYFHSLPDSSKTKTEQATHKKKTKQQSRDLMKFSLSKSVFVEPDARGSGVPLIKVLTCFDMREWVLSLCFSVFSILIFFILQSSSDTSENKSHTDTVHSTVKRLCQQRT